MKPHKQFCMFPDPWEEIDSTPDICCEEAEPGSMFCAFHIGLHTKQLWDAQHAEPQRTPCTPGCPLCAETEAKKETP